MKNDVSHILRAFIMMWVLFAGTAIYAWLHL